MKKLLLGTVALAAMIAGPAMAADMPVKAPPPPLLYDWSGVYVGFSAGGMWYDIDRTFPNSPIAGNFTTSDSDAIYGFHAGFQQQWGAWVLGVETSLSGCFRECRGTSGVLPVAAGFVAERRRRAQDHQPVHDRPAARLRLGSLHDLRHRRRRLRQSEGPVLQHRDRHLRPGGSRRTNGQTWNWGWFAGAGIEYMVHKGPLVDVTLGVEYQHWDVDGKQRLLRRSCLRRRQRSDYNLGGSGDLVRARLTIKTPGWGYFGAPAPLVAKY